MKKKKGKMKKTRLDPAWKGKEKKKKKKTSVKGKRKEEEEEEEEEEDPNSPNLVRKKKGQKLRLTSD